MGRSRVVARIALIPMGLLLAALALELLLQLAGLVVAATGSELPQAWRTGDRRVLCLGDSNTYGLWLKHRDLNSYPAQLEALWNQGDRSPIEVMNLGYPGSNSSRVLGNLREMLDVFSPELVIVMVGANDFWTAPIALPTDSEVSGTSEASEDPAWMRFLAKHSRLHKLLYMLARSTAADSLEIDEASGKDPDGTRATARFGEHVFDMSWTRAERAERSHPDELASNLRSIVEATRDAGARIALMTYPSRNQHYGRANSFIRAAAQATKAPLIDLERDFRPLCPEVECPKWLFSDQHPRPSGYRVIAEQIVEAGAELGL
jgi:lysophospholipase L1-like esterase